MQDSVFTKIIKGEIPCHKVYEDELTFAFLTISPVRPGHTLVIPKKQVDHLWDLPDEDYQAVAATTKKVANRIREVFQPLRVGEQVAGTEVPHAHVHVFPFDTIEEFWAHPEDAPKQTDEQLAATAARLRMPDGTA
jgi:histidine triad (HIT) family protein